MEVATVYSTLPKKEQELVRAFLRALKKSNKLCARLVSFRKKLIFSSKPVGKGKVCSEEHWIRT